MTKRTDWENVNMGCMFVCMNNAIDSIMRMIQDDGELSEKLFDDDDLDVLSETLSLIDSKREKVCKMLSEMFKEDRESRGNRESENESEEQEEEEYRIQDDDEAVKEVIIALCRRKK